MEGSARYGLAAQLERTVLAWNRSSLAVAANGGLLAREGFTRHLAALTVGGFAVVGVAAATWMLSTSRYPAARDRQAGHLLAGRRHATLGATLFIVVLSLVELVLAVTS
jgi:uncharacterized membrane protein YidH (DUF202 family)